MEEKMEEKTKSSLLPWILVAVLGVIVLVLAGFLGWKYFLKPKSETATTLTPTETTTPSGTTTGSQTSEQTSGETTGKTIKDVHCLQNPTKGTLITIESPAEYSTAKNPLTFSGKANVFENTFSYRLKDCRGPVISEGTITAEGESGTMAPYSQTITPSLSRSPIDVILEVFELSMKDGSETNLYQIPLRLTK